MSLKSKLLAGCGGARTDPYWPYVSLLANTTSSNGAQNNTFLDSSTNNFTITRNGNTTQGSFTPYGSNWSNYFDGSGDYLSIPNNAALNMSGSTFTLECWIYPNGDYSDYRTIMSKRNASTTSYQMFLFQTTGYLTFSRANTAYQSSATPTANAWNHIAAVYDGTNINLYLNGTRVLQTAVSIADTTDPLLIGAIYTGGENFNGYISNARVLKGVQAYSGATYTVPTAPLTAISGTSLLTCQSNRFIDNSTNNFTITKNGDTKVTPFSPFSPTSAYSTTANGGSAYFDGSGDYLTASSNAAFDFSTSDFTVECWFFLNASSSNMSMINNYNAGTAGWGIQYRSDVGEFRFFWGDTVLLSYATTPTVGAWTHIAVARSGTSLKMYLNGAQVASATNSTSLSGGSGVTIGSLYASGSYVQNFNGFLSNVRVVKGTAVYTAAFTPPTAPVTAITNTSLLLNATNAGIYDSAVQNDMETVGNAQVSTTQAKFGTTSMYFDGSGDSNRIAVNQPALQFGTGNFTAEGWIYSTGGTGTYQHVLTGGTSWTSGSGGIYWYYNGGSPTLGAAWNQLPANPAVNSGTLSINTWYHFALVRNGNTLTLYINGTSVSTYSVTGYSLAFNNQSRTNIGGGGWDNDFAGYVDELRVTAGVARYTANFTPPTAAFPVQ